MRRGAQAILGEHDFRAFCASGAQTKDFVRTVYSLDITKQDGIVTIDVCGNGFLYNMVRIIAGTLVYVGTGAHGVRGGRRSCRLMRPGGAPGLQLRRMGYIWRGYIMSRRLNGNRMQGGWCKK